MLILLDSSNISAATAVQETAREKEKDKLAEGRKPVDVYPLWKLATHQEKQIRAANLGESSPYRASQSKMPYTGPLSVDAFPPNWPTIPFSYRSRRHKAYIPLHHLPSKLTVHDPWNLLAMSSSNHLGKAMSEKQAGKDEWKKMQDRPHTYKLRIFRETREVEMYAGYEDVSEYQEHRAKGLMRTMESIWEENARNVELLEGDDEGPYTLVWSGTADSFPPLSTTTEVKKFYKGAYINTEPMQLLFRGLDALKPEPAKDGVTPSAFTSEQVSTQIPAPITIIHYPPPSSGSSRSYWSSSAGGRTPLGENTHIYVSPEKLAGSGHHSRAYKVEWEVPRGYVFPDEADGVDQASSAKEEKAGKGEEDYVLCQACVLEDVKEQLSRLGGKEMGMGGRKGRIIRITTTTTVSEPQVEHDETDSAPESEEYTTPGQTVTPKVESEIDPDTSAAVDFHSAEDSSIPSAAPGAPASTLSPPSPIPPAPLTEPESPESPLESPQSDSSSQTSMDSHLQMQTTYTYTYRGPLRPVLTTTKWQHRMRPKCKHLDPLWSQREVGLEEDVAMKEQEEEEEEEKVEKVDDARKDDEAQKAANVDVEMKEVEDANEDGGEAWVAVGMEGVEEEEKKDEEKKDEEEKEEKKDEEKKDGKKDDEEKEEKERDEDKKDEEKMENDDEYEVICQCGAKHADSHLDHLLNECRPPSLQVSPAHTEVPVDFNPDEDIMAMAVDSGAYDPAHDDWGSLIERWLRKEEVAKQKEKKKEPPILPPTTKVRVLAKLTHPGGHDYDCGHSGCSGGSSDHVKHLKREARCYEKFEEGMWTHWGSAKSGQGEGSGGEQGDIELGAIVPRYYGYWVHDEECPCREEAERAKGEEERKSKKDGEDVDGDAQREDANGSGGEKNQKLDLGYFSDILLMENCGSPVGGKRLRTREKEQVHNLLKRFHSYGWTHGSPYERNVVWDWGPINRDMSKRPTDWDGRKLSFRLIDFGRAEYHGVWDTDQEEEHQEERAKFKEVCAKEMRYIRSDF